MAMGFDERKFCLLCAWRQFCQKKFSYSRDVALHCADYVRDLTIKDMDVPPEKEEGRALK